jgi:hypothetical protein
MLNFFFSRNCFMVSLMEALGLAGLCVLGYQLAHNKLSLLQVILISLVLIQYLFIRFCSLWPWYPSKARSLGIGLQFAKAIITTSYILACTTWLFFFTGSVVPLIIAIVLLLLTAHVNIILLYLHFKDRDPTPVNLYSHS